jgi:hypothetical protein
VPKPGIVVEPGIVLGAVPPCGTGVVLGALGEPVVVPPMPDGRRAGSPRVTNFLWTFGPLRPGPRRGRNGHARE